MIHRLDRDAVLAAMTGRFADFYQTYGPLKPEGQRMRGPCPVHGGSGPNFTIDPLKGLWFCHSQGCGKPGGDIFDFVKTVEGVTFLEALERVAAFTAVVPDAPTSFYSVSRSSVSESISTVLKDQLLDVTLAEEMHQRLTENPKVIAWLLEHRGWTMETLVRFQIGLLPTTTKDEEWRICFPVYNRQGRLTNIRKHLFAYKPELTDDRRRSLGKTLPWRKGLWADLFPLSVLDGNDEVLIVEGEADAVLACQLGYAAVTGTLGAGTWKQHWTEEFRGFKRATILYDDDRGGHVGTQKVAAAIASVVSDVRIARYNAFGLHFDQEGARG